MSIKNKHLNRLFNWLSLKMIKSAIFDTKQVVMQRPLFISFVIWVLVSANITAQYTETINTNRPGTSQGAFSVGKNVVQFETGLALGSEKHSVFDNQTNTTEFKYNVRIGLLLERLEFNVEGSYLRLSSDDQIGNESGITRSGFPLNAIGVKYLIYDPYKYQREKSTNILSWYANKKINWQRFIPAVSAYAAANFISSTGDLAFQNNPDNRATDTQPNVAPRIIVSAHNVWSERLVFVANLVSNNLGSEFPEFRFLTTVTYNFNSCWSFFGEYEAITSQINKDQLIKAGGAFLATKNLQFDARILGNFKNTPSIFNLAFGASYRLDYHKNSDNEYIDTGENHDAKKYVALIKKDIESGHLDESALTGKLQSVIEDDVIVERFGGVDLESFANEEEEEEEEFDEEFDGDFEEEDTRIRWWQIGKKRRLRKRALSDTLSNKSIAGTGGRRSDFLDDDFIKQKQAEITPAERTPEQLAELELRREEEASKKKKKLFGRKNKANEVYVDKITGDSIPPPDYSSMTRKERKIAEKKHKELFELDELGLNNLDLEDFADSIEEEQNTREAEKARKKKEKEAKKKAKKERKRKKKEGLLYEGDSDELEFGEEEQKAIDAENSAKQEAEEFELNKALKEDKELQRLEEQIAREEEKERKRLEKEAAKKAKKSKSKAKQSKAAEKAELKRLEELEKAEERAFQEQIRADELKARELQKQKDTANSKRANKEKLAEQKRRVAEDKEAKAAAKQREKASAAERKAESARKAAQKEAALAQERQKQQQKEKEKEASKKKSKSKAKPKKNKTAKKKKKSKRDELDEEDEEEF